MKLSELIHEVWKDERIRKAKIKKSDVKIIINVMADHIIKGLIERGQVKLGGLFTLSTKRNKGRKITNPLTGKPMKIRDFYRVSLKPSKKLKEGLESLRD